MEFIQIVEMRTSKFDELNTLGDGFFAATEGKRTLKASYVGRDRNDPDRYFLLAFFDSHDAAMANSNLPETAALAEKQAALLDGPSIFTDLDILEHRA